MHVLIFFLIVLGMIDYVEITAVVIPFSDYMSKITVLDFKIYFQGNSSVLKCDFEMLLNKSHNYSI